MTIKKGSKIVPLRTLKGSAQGTNRQNSSGSFVSKAIGQDAYYFTATLAANSQVSVPIQGTNFYFVSSTGTLFVQPQGMSANSYSQGTGLNVAKSGSQFSSLSVINETGIPVTFVLFVGFNEFIDRRSIIVAGSLPSGLPIEWTATSLLCGGGQTLTNVGGIFVIAQNTGSQITIPGTLGPISGLGIRKQVVIQNLAASGSGLNLQTVDFVDRGGYVIAPQIPYTIELSGAIYVNNDSGSTINWTCSEVYFNN